MNVKIAVQEHIPTTMETANYRTAKFAQKDILLMNQARLSALPVQEANIMPTLGLLRQTIIDVKLVHQMYRPAKKEHRFAVDVQLDGPTHPMQRFLVLNVDQVGKVYNAELS